VALVLLDELRMRMMECRLVLQALPDEADLNFDELATSRVLAGSVALALSVGVCLRHTWVPA
jgi:hypothetical protein